MRLKGLATSESNRDATLFALLLAMKLASLAAGITLVVMPLGTTSLMLFTGSAVASSASIAASSGISFSSAAFGAGGGCAGGV